MDEEEYILKMCTTKTRYKKLKSAERALRLIKKTGKLVSPNFLPYKCPYCHGFHLGHRRPLPKSDVKIACCNMCRRQLSECTCGGMNES